jgi:hypothetical protein
MNSEPNPKAQMPTGKARQAAGVVRGERGLCEACTGTRHLQCHSNSTAKHIAPGDPEGWTGLFIADRVSAKYVDARSKAMHMRTARRS